MITALYNSMKLWAMPCHATHGHPKPMGHGGQFWQNNVYWRRQWQTTLVFLPQEPHEHNEKIWHWKMIPPRSVSVQYATEEEWGEKELQNEEAKPKWKQCPVVDVCGGESKVACWKEPASTGTWNAAISNLDKLGVVKWRWQEWTSTF